MARYGIQYGLPSPEWRPKTFQEWVLHAPTAYLVCRASGHNFADDDNSWIGQNVKWAKDGSCMLYQVCPRCALPCDRYIGPMGEVDGNRNVYHYDLVQNYPYLFHGHEDLASRTSPKERKMLVRVELRRRKTEGKAVDASTGVVTPIFRS